MPFGEYIPWRGLINHLTSLTSLVPQNFLPGHTPGTLTVGPATIADVMCFEVAFDEQVRDGVTHGGQLIVVQTNNATYMHTAETRQQLAMSQLRAVEHGRAVVVAATQWDQRRDHPRRSRRDADRGADAGDRRYAGCAAYSC